MPNFDVEPLRRIHQIAGRDAAVAQLENNDSGRMGGADAARRRCSPDCRRSSGRWLVRRVRRCAPRHDRRRRLGVPRELRRGAAFRGCVRHWAQPSPNRTRPPHRVLISPAFLALFAAHLAPRRAFRNPERCSMTSAQRAPESSVAVAQTDQKSGASICDGAAHAEAHCAEALDGTRPSNRVDFVLRIPLLRAQSLWAGLRDSHASLRQRRCSRRVPCRAEEAARARDWRHLTG